YAGLTRTRGRGRKGDRFVSFIAGTSMVGIALGVAALIIVLSVMNGFQVDVRDRMLSVLPHIQLVVPNEDPVEVTDDWQRLADAAKQNPQVEGASAFVAAGGMLARGDVLKGVE